MTGSNRLGAEAAYFDHLQRGVFALQVCSGCRHTIFPPREFCPECECGEIVWQPQDGRGEVHSVTTVRVTEKGVAPYNVSLISLDNGAKMMSAVPGVPVDDVRIGLRVQARIEKTQDTNRVVFDIVSGDAG